LLGGKLLLQAIQRNLSFEIFVDSEFKTSGSTVFGTSSKKKLEPNFFSTSVHNFSFQLVPVIITKQKENKNYITLHCMVIKYLCVLYYLGGYTQLEILGEGGIAVTPSLPAPMHGPYANVSSKKIIK
jgi:hypothetical protein